MLEVTQTAREKLAEYLRSQKLSGTFRVYQSYGWGGPTLSLALDEPKDSDDVYDVDGFQYVVDKEFLKKATPIKVDFREMGFSISSSIKLGAGCSSCGTGTCG